MLPLLKLLLTHQTMSLAECTRQMCDVFGLSEAERVKLLKSKRQTVIRNRVGWAKFYLSKAGLLDVVSRGKYMLSQEGGGVSGNRIAVADGKGSVAVSGVRRVCEGECPGRRADI